MPDKLEGITVTRLADRIVLDASTDRERAMLKNAARLYRIMDAARIAPHLLAEGDGWIALEDLGVSHFERDPDDGELRLLFGGAYLLGELREFGIVHGDLTAKNLIVRDRVYAIDFQEARLVDEPASPDERPEGDAHWFWTAAVEITGDGSRRFRRWLAIRRYVTGPLLDVGAGPGHFCAMAEAEGIDPVQGIDIAADPPVDPHGILPRDAFDADFTGFATIICFSAWPYMVQQRGRDDATDLLQSMIASADQLFFETQYAGDGPGPDFLPDDLACAELLRRVGGTPEILTSIPVAGRDASRTVWRVT